MTDTEIMLLAVHRAPAVPLSDICEKYLNLQPKQANEKARLRTLPIPAWRLTESQKAPFMVRLADLAKLIDDTAAAADEARLHAEV